MWAHPLAQRVHVPVHVGTLSRINIPTLILVRAPELGMSAFDDLSEDELQQYANGTRINVVSAVTSPSGDTLQRPLDASDINELQQSRLLNIPNGAVYTVIPSENRAFFHVTIRETALERVIEQRRRNDKLPDDIGAEYVLASEASWVASTLNNGQHLRRNIGRVSHDDYRVEIAPDGTSVRMNIIFEGDQ